MSELAWLRHKDIAVAGRGDIGAQGIRQAGRLMMMERSADFMSRVEQEVHAAMGGLFDPVVYVHVLTGLSGGTGSGCFLDVCYMVRDAARRMGRDVTILGYFFLPDVNLARIPMSSTSVRECVRANAYAAMQELDYCMGLPHNGGAFEQEYQGRRVVGWDRPPVDVPFLVGA